MTYFIQSLRAKLPAFMFLAAGLLLGVIFSAAAKTVLADLTADDKSGLITAGQSFLEEDLYVAGNANIFKDIGISGGRLHVDAVTGNVGIGDPSPDTRLTVAGDIRTTGYVGAGCPDGGTCSPDYVIMYPNGEIVATKVVTAAGFKVGNKTFKFKYANLGEDTHSTTCSDHAESAGDDREDLNYCPGDFEGTYYDTYWNDTYSGFCNNENGSYTTITWTCLIRGYVIFSE